MKTIPVMTKSIDDDPENANWLRILRTKKKKSVNKLKDKILKIVEEKTDGQDKHNNR